jgi:hypothetical protein
MPIVKLPFANGFYIADSLPVSQQEAINCYPVIHQAPALNENSLYATPGIAELTSTTNDEPNRGAHTMAGIPYFVNGNKLYRMNRTSPSGSYVYDVDDLGTIEGSGRVWMESNENEELCILVPGGKGYIFTDGPDTLTEITDADFRASGDPQALLYIDGYFLFTTDEKKHIISDLNQGLVYNALDFGSAESDPDDIVAPFKHRNQLFIAGTETTEGFQNIGGADYPFQRSGVFIDKGMSAPFAGVNISDAFVFMGAGKKESPAIWLYGGGVQATKISTTAIESILQDLTDTEIAAVFAWSYAQKGGYFVGFTLPETTLVYDTVTQLWHERKSYALDFNSTQQTAAYRVNSVIKAYGLVLVGDSEDGRIGYMDDDLFTEYGTSIIRQFTTQPFQNNMQALFVPWIELTIESGVGDSTTEEPQITMFRSKDGRIWSDGRSRSMGKEGEYTKRCIWRRNGRVARFETFRFRMSDPVKFSAIQLTAKVK